MLICGIALLILASVVAASVSVSLGVTLAGVAVVGLLLYLREVFESRARGLSKDEIVREVEDFLRRSSGAP